METTLTLRTSTAAIWLGALASALTAAAVLFDTIPAINWPIWVASASAGVILARQLSGLDVDRPLLILLGWATLLAGAVAVTSSERLHVLVILSDAMLLGLAILVMGVRDWDSLSAKLLALVPVLAPFRIALASLRETADAPRNIASARIRPVVRGMLLTVPVLILLIALLRKADPVFGWLTDRLNGFLPDWSVSGRVLIFLFTFALTLGANAIAARQRDARIPDLPPIIRRSSLGVTEQRIILGSVTALLWLFVLLQLSYLFHPLPNTAGNGVTFAEYARQGFAQLSVAVTMVSGIIVLLARLRPVEVSPGDVRVLGRMEAALFVALELILLSAFRRVLMYEDAYGFTTTRLYAQCYMVVVAIALVALWLEVRTGAITINFARRVSVIALGLFTVLVYWNHEAWTVNRNIDRVAETKKFDSAYALTLSMDVIPTLLRRRAEIPLNERLTLEAKLACIKKQERHWFEWNRRVSATDDAVQIAKLPPCGILSGAHGASRFNEPPEALPVPSDSPASPLPGGTPATLAPDRKLDR